MADKIKIQVRRRPGSQRRHGPGVSNSTRIQKKTDKKTTRKHGVPRLQYKIAAGYHINQYHEDLINPHTYYWLVPDNVATDGIEMGQMMSVQSGDGTADVVFESFFDKFAPRHTQPSKKVIGFWPDQAAPELIDQVRIRKEQVHRKHEKMVARAKARHGANRHKK